MRKNMHPMGMTYRNGDSYKKGLGRAFRAARDATKYTAGLREVLIEIAQRCRNLAEQQKEVIGAGIRLSINDSRRSANGFLKCVTVLAVCAS
jgi:hypothetical protein